ncbi:MAG: hypothetical protein ACI956_002532, partial [Nonlabens sp.]
NDYVNQNDHRESGLYNCFHEKNREIIFCVILTTWREGKLYLVEWGNSLVVNWSAQ